MNRLQSIFVIMLLVTALGSCSEKAKRAKVYHNEIFIKTSVVIDSVIDYSDAVHSGSRQVGLAVSTNYLNLIAKTTESVIAKGDFDADSTLKVAAVNLLHFYGQYVSATFVPYFQSFENDSLNEFQLAVADSLLRKMMDEEVPHWSNFNNEGKKFSDRYDISSVKE
jgi:hypothetical protein